MDADLTFRAHYDLEHNVVPSSVICVIAALGEPTDRPLVAVPCLSQHDFSSSLNAC